MKIPRPKRPLLEWIGAGVLVAIVAIAIVLPRVARTPRRPIPQPTSISFLGTALGDFEVDMGHYPSSLFELVNRPLGATNWQGPYMPKIPKDPFGHDFIYRCPGKHNTNGYDLYCIGPDGQTYGNWYRR